MGRLLHVQISVGVQLYYCTTAVISDYIWISLFIYYYFFEDDIK